MFSVGIAFAAEDIPSQTVPPAPPSVVRAEVGHGHEHYSSPLVRFSDEGPLFRIEGRTILAGDYQRVAVNGSTGINISDRLSLQTSGGFEDKRFPIAKDLDFRLYSVDPLLRWQLENNHSVGFGPGLQRIDVVRRHFRNRQSWQSDWTYINPDSGYVTVVIDYGRNRHAEEFKDLDSTSGLLLMRRQFLNPVRFLNEVAIEAGLGKETNLNQLHELSSRQQYARISTEWDTWALKWGGSFIVQKARFKAASLDELPIRQDVFSALDISCEYSLSKDVFLRIDVSRANNRANSALFESRFNGHSVTIGADF